MTTKIITVSGSAFDLTSQATVFNYNNALSEYSLFNGIMFFSGLTNSGYYTLDILINDFYWENSNNTYLLGSGNVFMETYAFLASPSDNIKFKVTSPNSGDTSVYVTSKLLGTTDVSELLTTADISPVISINVPATNFPSYNGNTLSVFKGVTWDINVSGIGPSADDFYFTIKKSSALPDSQADLQINNSGTFYINKTAYVTSSGYTTYSSGNNGTVNISVTPEVTSQITGDEKYVWDIKSINATNVVAFGFINIKEDITDKYH